MYLTKDNLFVSIIDLLHHRNVCLCLLMPARAEEESQGLHIARLLTHKRQRSTARRHKRHGADPR